MGMDSYISCQNFRECLPNAFQATSWAMLLMRILFENLEGELLNLPPTGQEEQVQLSC